MQPQSTIPCSFPGCDRFSSAKNLCKKHYEQSRTAAIPGYRERENARQAVWRAEHTGDKKQIQARYRSSHKEQLSAKDRSYRRAYPEAATDRVLHYTAKIKGAVIVERVYRKVVFERDGGRCHVCGELVDPARWTIDHLIPLSKGGEHSYRNVAVSHPHCNFVRYNTGPAQLRLFGHL